MTWTMSAHHNFLEKAFCLVMNGKKMIGGDMEKGLGAAQIAGRAKELVCALSVTPLRRYFLHALA